MRLRVVLLTLVAVVAGAYAWVWGDEPMQSGSATGVSAADLLFSDSDLEVARAKAERILKNRPTDLDALFVAMEASALEADTAAELDAAVRLCETRSVDPRVTIAAARILDLAANTSAFRTIAPRVRLLARSTSFQVNYFRSALLKAASDGLPGDSVRDLARQAGLLTEWRLAGPFGRFGNVDFDRAWAPENEGLTGTMRPELFRFDDGSVSLPEYFRRGGVYYAEAEVTVKAAGQYLLRAESAGTLAVTIGGTTVLHKDDRFRVSSGIAVSRIRLSGGKHRVLVKFLPSASPFRIALIPAERIQTAPEVGQRTISDAEAIYVAAAEKYWSGDYPSAIAALKKASRLSAAHEFLLAQAWAQEESSNSLEAISALQAALAASSRATSAAIMLADEAYSAERVDEALERVRDVLAIQPDYLPAQELLSRIAMHNNWHHETARALEARMRLRPNCETLHDAAKFFSTSMQFERSAELEQRLKGCSPSSLAYVEVLSDAGRHREAAAAASAQVAQRPLDREARYLLVQELRLSGDFSAAAKSAAELASLAPNSARFRRLAEKEWEQIEDDEGGRAAGFESGDTFYAPFRREAHDILARTNNREFSGKRVVILLHDQVVRLEPDGAAAVYVHKITRVLTREGIERYGEIAIPKGSDLLELRTLKSDGSVIEPELLREKSTVSMPALAPGDVIEQEYVTRYPTDSVAADPEVFRFAFGSFETPIVLARFAVISPKNSVQPVVASAGVPEPLVKNGGVLRIWEKNDIAQSEEEVAVPRGDVLPTVCVLPLRVTTWQAVRDYYRDLAIPATRIGSRVQATASAISSDGPEKTARALYRLVTSRIRGGSTIWGANVSSAEETLASGEGSRTATFLALVRAAGIRADLVLAHKIGTQDEAVPNIQAYSRPLVRLTLNGQAIFLDAEAEGMPFGTVPPVVDGNRALLVPLEGPSESLFVALAGSTSDAERSVAQADIKLSSDGDLVADLAITMGASRGAQMRSILGDIPASGRQHFFEQLAARIFPGASEVRGEVRHEHETDLSLVLRMACRSPRLLSFNGRSADLDQLAPALNLRKMYVGAGSRRFSLYIDAPLIEDAIFRVQLPPDVRLSQRADDLEEHTRFGDYAVHFRELKPDLLEITRSFRIPPQVVPPSQYGEFVQFAIRIDNAERQRLAVERVGTTAQARSR